MVLARHVDPEELLEQLTIETKTKRGNHFKRMKDTSLTPYSNKYSISALSKHVLPKEGAPAEAVAQMIRDELDLDGRPNLNLASFVGTYMEKEAERLMIENLAKNMSDADEYPAMMDIHARCISIIAHMWGVQKGERAIGSATTGSSEAIHLGGLAMKQLWKEKRQAAGKDISKPNIIMGANAQVALEKFARYFDVEARILDVSAASQYVLDPKKVRENVDENTIGVFVILGSTYTGTYESVQAVSDVLDDYEKETGNYIPIHVDAASGGFVAPFTDAKAGEKWNFELPRVHSINVSGHKFGLVYAGVGWILWRDEKYLPKHLIFELHYLGGTEESFTLNFSRPGAQIIAQYYNLIHLGHEGYREIMEHTLENARTLSNALEATGWYRCVSGIHRKKGDYEYKAGQDSYENGATSAAYNPGLPVVAFTFTDAFKKDHPRIQQESVSKMMRMKGYIIPNYPLPPTEEKTEILRVVVRESMALDLLDKLVCDICDVTESLMDIEDVFDIATWEPFPKKQSSTKSKKDAQDKTQSKGKDLKQDGHNIKDGVYRSVC